MIVDEGKGNGTTLQRGIWAQPMCRQLVHSMSRGIDNALKPMCDILAQVEARIEIGLGLHLPQQPEVR